MDVRYQKHKLAVKIWEKEFKKKHDRVPSKYDIREAPKNIRESYKMYYKLKTSFLEDTLNDVLAEDGFDVLEMSQNDDGCEPSVSPVVPAIMDLTNSPFSNVDELPNTSAHYNVVNLNNEHVIKQFEVEEELELNKNAWGKSVSHNTPSADIKVKDPQTKLAKSNLKHRLFETSSFSKRNPRKSFSRANSAPLKSTIMGLGDQQHEVLPDLELILTQKAREQQQLSAIVANPLLGDGNKTLVKRQVDEDWLNRTTQTRNQSVTPRIDEHPKRMYGLSNVDMTKITWEPQQGKSETPTVLATATDKDREVVMAKPKMNEVSSDSVVSDSEEEEAKRVHKRRRIDATGALNADPNAPLEQRQSGLINNNQAGVSKNQPKKKPRETKRKIVDLDKAKKKDLEPNAKQGRRQKHASQKVPKNASDAEVEEEQPLNPEELKYRLALEADNISSVPRIKQSDLSSAQAVVEKYVNSVVVAPLAENKPSRNLVVDEKRAAARKKLEDKVASGKLNENFQTINIQKKTYTRGKKSVNYSKYKKKLWKDKKRIGALTGPDMDMRGCDGGALVCFSCGRNGHMARDCKVKGDALLPLTAQLEEDPSPFPTLEEAGAMAAQTAVVVHSHDISKMPESVNTAIFSGPVENAPADSADSASENTDTDTDDALFESDEELHNLDIERLVNEASSASPHSLNENGTDGFLKQLGVDMTASGKPGAGVLCGVDALYELDEHGCAKDATPEVLEALNLFGHSSFRKGQDRAIMRILSGLSTLVTLSTGSGKSLCYQLPAYLYSRLKQSITLVISPLVSLMEDQVTDVPHFLRAHCLHTNQTAAQRLKILQLIADGEVDVLLVSPEAVVAGERATGFGSILRQLPPIAFACIDEAHCVSQWSHNFRPSYLMICKVLRDNLGVRTILGLTATATLPTRQSIISHLGILDGERGIISDVPLPDNLMLSVSRDVNRDAALLELLHSKRFKICQSIIIYCTRRDECERVATFLRTTMQAQKPEDNGKRKRASFNWQAEPYHAGLVASRRRTIQKAFMRNELRIVVATIAFGMGINKPDIRSVIHYNMPRNFESYVQEIGRAGRDGRTAHCHVFLDPHGNDQNELRRHVYANSIDRHAIRKLLRHVFVPCSCQTNKRTEPSGKQSRGCCSGHEIGFSVEQTVEALDLPQENISTLLCYLELDTRYNIKVLSSAYIMAKVISYGGAKYLKYAAKRCPPLAMAIALEIKKDKFHDDSNVIEFSAVDIASAIGWNSGIVKYQLKNLEWIEVNGRPKRAPINVSFYDLGFRLRAPGDFTADGIDDALDVLYDRCLKQEHTQLIQLQYAFQSISAVAFDTYKPCSTENFSDDRSNQLKGIVRDYFCNNYPKDLQLEILISPVSDDTIRNDINALINIYPENNFSGRNIARIFHGISSPNYTALMWSRCKYWRAYTKVDFNHIVKLANIAIVQCRN